VFQVADLGLRSLVPSNPPSSHPFGRPFLKVARLVPKLTLPDIEGITGWCVGEILVQPKERPDTSALRDGSVKSQFEPGPDR